MSTTRFIVTTRKAVIRTLPMMIGRSSWNMDWIVSLPTHDPVHIPGRPADHHGQRPDHRFPRCHDEPGRRHRLLVRGPPGEVVMSMQFDEVVPVQEAAPRLVEVTEAPMGAVVLKVDNLTVKFPSDEGPVNAVQNLSYEARLGRTLAIVGESGSGKSVSTMTVLGLHNPARTFISGSVNLD